MTTPSQLKKTEQERIDQLEKQNEELKRLITWYEEQLRLMVSKKFGASSEKVNKDQLEFPLFNEAEITADVEVNEDSSSCSISNNGKKQTRKVRETQIEHLPVETVVYSLPQEEQACSSCGHDMHVMNKEVSREIVIIPAKVKVIEHEREVYACRQCEKNDISTPIVIAPMPNRAFPNSMASPSSVAYVINQKYGMAVPLYRLEQQFQREGVGLSRQTLSNWVISAAEKWIVPMVQLMKDTLVKQDILHADETSLQVLREDGRKAQSKSYMWEYRTGRESPPCIVYEYQTTRSSKHPKKFLEEFKGILHVDGYQGYMDIPKVTLSGCWAHARRKFVEAQKSAPQNTKGIPTIAEQAIQKINDLYLIEKRIVDFDSEKRYEVRQKESLPLVQAFFAWLKSKKNEVLPKSKLGEAIQYSLNQQKKLEVPFNDGRLEIDNNRAERAMKSFAVGRKNWLFSNTPKGANSSAAIFSLIETAKENGLNPFEYLNYLFETLPNLEVLNSETLELHAPWSKQLPLQCYSKKQE